MVACIIAMALGPAGPGNPLAAGCFRDMNFASGHILLVDGAWHVSIWNGILLWMIRQGVEVAVASKGSCLPGIRTLLGFPSASTSVNCYLNQSLSDTISSACLLSCLHSSRRQQGKGFDNPTASGHSGETAKLRGSVVTALSPDLMITGDWIE